jgi:hypothetical protein
MKRFFAVALLGLSLAACAVNPLATVTNPVNTTKLYQAELVFSASLKTFNKLKDLCVRRVIPSTCRTYVVQGQGIIRKASAADVAARNFVDKYPTLDATNVVQSFVGLVGDFTGTVDRLSALQQGS